MSDVTYNNLWIEARTILTEAAIADTFLHNENVQEDKLIFHNALCEIYFKYIIAANKLNECYDQIFHPQKRMLIRTLLDGCLGRIVELKNDLIHVDISEFSYNDDVLIKICVSPMEAELTIPKYFRRESMQDTAYKRKFIDDVLHKFEDEQEEEQNKQLTEVEAIKIIQVHERARQGRLRSQFVRVIRLLNENENRYGDEEISYKSALMIQKIWRGFTTRRKFNKREIDEMLLIGMIQPRSVNLETFKKAEQISEYRHELQEVHQKEYLESQELIEGNIKDKKAAIIMEEISEEVRNWFREYYDHWAKFPEFPSKESGGSRMIGQENEIEVDKSKSSKKKSKKNEKEMKKGKKSDKKSKDSKDSKLGYKITPSIFLPLLVSANEEYERVWRNNDNFFPVVQKHNEDMIYVEKYNKVEEENREIADDKMRGELDLLETALVKDKSRKGKKSKKGKKKKRKTKKKKRGKKGKKKKDLTSDRTTESLFEELVSNGIIKKYPEVSIDSFMGEKSFAATDLRNDGKNATPGLGDIRQVIKEYCIIPMGSDMIHKTAPLIRSVLISGPRGSGKKMLVNAICTELGAVLFDLTPSNLVGKYPGKKGLLLLVHLVNKVSRLLQPSIIFMDDAEKPFTKKIPKTDKTNPKRLKKTLPKLVKGITLNDRIMFIGTSECPWTGGLKFLRKTFQKFVQIPMPNYGSIFHLWNTLLRQYTGIGLDFDISSIAKMSDGYTVGEILKVMQSIVTAKRIVQFHVNPLTHTELIVAFSKHEPIFRGDDLAAERWWWKTPLGKKKKKALAIDEERRKKNIQLNKNKQRKKK